LGKEIYFALLFPKQRKSEMISQIGLWQASVLIYGKGFKEFLSSIRKVKPKRIKRNKAGRLLITALREADRF
jgi:hypothetical protein